MGLSLFALLGLFRACLELDLFLNLGRLLCDKLYWTVLRCELYSGWLLYCFSCRELHCVLLWCHRVTLQLDDFTGRVSSDLDSDNTLKHSWRILNR